MPLYTLRTTSGREDIVIDLLETRIKAEAIDIKSVFHPAEIKGYIFIEGKLGEIHKAIQGLMHVRGLIEKAVKISEVQHFLEYKTARIKVGIGDIVEIIGGPFKGEKGKIKRVDSVKAEVTVELLEASIPIPVTIATEFVKVIKRAKKEVEEKPKKIEKKESEKSVFDDLTPGETKEEPRELEKVEEKTKEPEPPKPEPVPEEKVLEEPEKVEEPKKPKIERVEPEVEEVPKIEVEDEEEDTLKGKTLLDELEVEEKSKKKKKGIDEEDF